MVRIAAEVVADIPRELAVRRYRSVEIKLAWRPSDDSVFLLVLDRRTRDAAVVRLPDRADAMRAFGQPQDYLFGDPAARRLRRSLEHPDGDAQPA
jgi:hypothetical protein